MKLYRIILILFSFLYTFSATAQKKVTLSGYVRDELSGEALIAANVFVKELQLGVQTNTYGFYSVTMPAGNYSILYSYVGYKPMEQAISMVDSRGYNAELKSNSVIEEVEIKATTRKDENIKTTEMGTITLGR